MKNLSTEEIVTLMKQLSACNLGKLEIESEDFRLHIESKVESASVIATQPIAPAAVAIASASAEPIVKMSEEESGNVMKAPIIGTFYAAPAPDQEPFVKVGQKVEKGDVLFIIESMKLMNEIQSEFSGTVESIFVENGSGVEYGQPILKIV